MIVPSRRGFLKASTGVVTSAGIASLAWAEKAPASERVRVGMAHFLIHSSGENSRGNATLPPA